MKDRIVIGTIPPGTLLSAEKAGSSVNWGHEGLAWRLAHQQTEANARLSMSIKVWEDWLLKDLERSTLFWTQFGKLFARDVTPVPWTIRLRQRLRGYCRRIHDAYLVLAGKADIYDGDDG